MQRIQLIQSHLVQNKTSTGQKSDDDVVICGAVRTPLTRASKGPLKDTPSELVVAHVLKALMERTKVKPGDIQDIVFGNVLQSGSANFPGRMGQFLANIPYDVPFMTLNRLCSSGLEACASIAAKIKAGVIDIGVGGGVENMTVWKMGNLSPTGFVAQEQIDKVPNAKACQLSMGVTSENVATKYGVTREQCDVFAYESQRKALEAQKKGLFKDEIVPITVTVVDKNKDGTVTKKEVLVTEDDGVRPTTMETLKKLPTVFKKDGGVSTAGNSSQTTEGGAAVLLARRSTAKKLGLPILAKWRSYAVAGVPPEVMGIGPAFAIPKALKSAGLTKDDIDIFEINEAFATQALYCVRELKIDEKRVNPKGGAIALGHPLGCTGARMVASLLPELKRTGGKLGVISMCIGTGMGAAAVLELEN
jgi:acetyl-CoA acyltransferase 1